MKEETLAFTVSRGIIHGKEKFWLGLPALQVQPHRGAAIRQDETVPSDRVAEHQALQVCKEKQVESWLRILPSCSRDGFQRTDTANPEWQTLFLRLHDRAWGYALFRPCYLQSSESKAAKMYPWVTLRLRSKCKLLVNGIYMMSRLRWGKIKLNSKVKQDISFLSSLLNTLGGEWRNIFLRRVEISFLPLSWEFSHSPRC